jgi:cation diffusion facilitator family transporter
MSPAIESKSEVFDASGEATDHLALRAAKISLLVSVLLLGLKLWAYEITDSEAIFSDAMETIVNVVASGLAIIVLNVAHKPADEKHPYGHGKVEFFSAAFEGGLIAFASVMICVNAANSFVGSGRVEAIGLGLAVTIFAGFANAALGYYLLRVGKKHLSETLQASGQHVLSDFWTSLGVTVGLVLVRLTGIHRFDSAIALVVGLYLGWTGIVLVRRSIGGLLDAEDRDIITNLAAVFEKVRTAEMIQLHHVRVMRSGRYHHIDAHAVVPEFWNVAEAHDQTDLFENRLIREYAHPGELHLHVDPCRRVYCRVCEVSSCPIRVQAFEKRIAISLDEFISPEEPNEFLALKNEK